MEYFSKVWNDFFINHSFYCKTECPNIDCILSEIIVITSCSNGWGGKHGVILAPRHLQQRHRPRAVHMKHSEPCRPCPSETAALTTAQTHTQRSRTTGGHAGKFPSLLMRGGEKQRGTDELLTVMAEYGEKDVKSQESNFEWRGVEEILERWGVCVTREHEKRGKIIYLGMSESRNCLRKQKNNNNIPLVDWREKNVSIHLHLDVSISRTEQRPHWTAAWCWDL